MTWTIFEHNVGSNETDDFAPGRGGYSIVLVPLGSESATEWWAEQYGDDPHRYCRYPEHTDEHAWEVEQVEADEEARAACGEMRLDEGGIGSPKHRLYTWSELDGRLDVNVVSDDEL